MTKLACMGGERLLGRYSRTVTLWRYTLLVAAMAVVADTACSTRSCPTIAPAPRDFTISPTIVDQPSFTRLYAISDIHGGYDRMVALLMQWGLISASPASPELVEWTGGDATLVVTGDLIDKGSQSIEVIDSLRALEASAATKSGHVIVMLGNHEAEFLADPYNSKADAFDSELTSQRLDPCVVATTEPRGIWLRTRPLGARIGDWFFSHAGETHGRTLAELEQGLRSGLAANDFRDAAVIGSESILESHDWWKASPQTAQRNADALGAAHIVFGHTPDALGPRGSIATGENGLLFRIDVGMSPAVDDSPGALLEITHETSDEVARELRADGNTNTLWRGPGR